MADIQVKAGQSLQTALDTANSGDQLILESGATFQRAKLTTKSLSDYVTLKPSATAPPKIVGFGTDPAILASQGAHHYRFQGIELLSDPIAPLTYNVVQLGDTYIDKTLDALPHHLIFDRCYVHGQPNQDIQRGISLNCGYTEITNCIVNEIHWRGAETQALGAWSGAGPFKIVANRLEAAGINILFGGAKPSVLNLVPSDIEIRDNYLFKPLSWRLDDPSYAGEHWSVKNLLELKNARRVVIDNNVMENSWPDAQIGWAVIFNCFRDAGWEVIEDVQFTRNKIKNCSRGINLRGLDDGDTAPRMKRITISDNEMSGLGSYSSSECEVFQILMGSESLEISHNTASATGLMNSILKMQSLDTVRHAGFKFINNLGPHGSYGVFGDNGYIGKDSFDKYASGYTFSKNGIVGTPLDLQNKYPDQYFPSSVEQGKTLIGSDGIAIGVRSTTTTPTPVPVPPPTPTPSPVTRKVAMPNSESKWNTLLNQQWGEGYRLKSFDTGPNVTFEKVK